MKGNIYELSKEGNDAEVFEELVKGDGVLVERIVSTGQVTPEGVWFDQERDEWVALLQGEAKVLLEKDQETIDLLPGDYLFIPARCRHRVTYTSVDPPCIWLAVHGHFKVSE
jgi:cupin 2 domain-containing protein